MNEDDDDGPLMPLGKALAAVRLGVISARGIDEKQWQRCMKQQEDHVNEAIKGARRAALEKEVAHIRKTIERSDDRAFTMRELDAQIMADSIDAEAELRRALEQDLAHATALLDEVP